MSITFFNSNILVCSNCVLFCCVKCFRSGFFTSERSSCQPFYCFSCSLSFYSNRLFERLVIFLAAQFIYFFSKKRFASSYLDFAPLDQKRVLKSQHTRGTRPFVTSQRTLTSLTEGVVSEKTSCRTHTWKYRAKHLFSHEAVSA